MTRIDRGLLARRWPSIIGVLTAILFLAHIASFAPHLVHHLLEPETHLTKCIIASSSERTPGIETECFTQTPTSDVEVLRPPTAPTNLPTLALGSSEARAPPRLAP